MKVRTRVSLFVIALTVVLVGFIIPAAAQDQSTDNMQIVKEKIRADKKLFVAVNLNLTDAESRDFWPVYEAYQKELGSLMERTIRLIEDYAGSYEGMSDETAKRLVDDYLAIQGEEVALMKSYLPRLRKVLSEKKVARYFQLENKISAVVDFELAAKIPLVK
jgi:hypothetical protein